MQVGECGYHWPLGTSTTTTSSKRFYNPCAAVVQAEIVAVGVGIAGAKGLPGHVVDLGSFEAVADGGELSFETARDCISIVIAGTHIFDATYRWFAAVNFS